MTRTDTFTLARRWRPQLEQPAVETVRGWQREVLGSGRHRLLPRPGGLGVAVRAANVTVATRLCAQFIAGEEAVTQDIQPFMAAMRAEGRLGDEMYLTQFAFEEAKHTQVFRLWLDAVGITDDLHGYLDDLPSYRQMFYEELPESLDALSTDPSPAAQVRASVTYNHVDRRHDGADRILCVAQDLRGPRHSSRHAGAGATHR